MSLIFTIVVATIVAGTFVYFWNDILEYLNSTVRDLIEKAFGKTWSDRFANFLVWLDKGIVLTKRTAQDAYKWFKEKFLGIKTVYTSADGTELKTNRKAIKTTTTTIKLTPDTAQETKTEEIVDWHEMPDSVRGDVIRHKADTVTVNDMDVVDRRYHEQLTMAH